MKIHTPDSSRYFYADSFQQNFEAGKTPKHLSKEFVREWLMENGFQGLEGQKMPVMTESVVQMITDRYIELYETVTGKKFQPQSIETIAESIENAI
jgi:phosphoribosylaminoimidazole-succinocarboxamide synthase